MGLALHLNKHEFPFTQKCFVPSLVEIGPVALEKMKIWKIYRQTDGQQIGRMTDDQKCSLELSAR